MPCETKLCTVTLFAFCGIAIATSTYAQDNQSSKEAQKPTLSEKNRILTTINSSIKPRAGQPPPPGSLPSDANPGLSVGVGYDSVSSQLKPRCVVETSANLPPAESLGQNGTFLVNYVTSEDDIARALGIDGSASFGNGIFSADASVQYLSSSKITQYSSYLMVSSTNKNSQQLLTHYHLTSAAKRALKQGLPRFVQLCGDQFVSGIVTGGSLSAVISASSTTTAEQIDANATLHAAGWGGSIDLATQSKLQTFLSNGRLNINVIRQGPAEPWPTATVADFISYAQQFPQKGSV
jgi:hypothetical protein